MLTAGLRGLFAAPLLCCGFRPFYLATALYAVLAMALWGVFFVRGWPLPPQMGGALAWHAHELIYGFAMASVAGFLLTAVPEFTASAPVQNRRLAVLFGLWLTARLTFTLAGVTGVWPAALLNLAFMVYLGWLIAPPVWRDRGRAHLSFVYALIALAALQAGYFVAAWRNEPVMPWLLAAVGVLMILIVLALSRISMRMVNAALDVRGAQAAYLARPPRRNLATFAIGLFTAIEFALPGNAVGGWLALAVAAALLNLLNDWHVGRALFSRWIFMLYSVYWLMALGYALIGLSLLGAGFAPSAGRHLLLVGALGLAVLAVMLVAGRTHSGRELDQRPWVLAAAGLVVAAALLRLLAGMSLVDVPAPRLWMLAALAWIGAFTLYAAYSWRLLTGPRPDAGSACEGPEVFTQPASQTLNARRMES
ncbi:MAG: NnrS family protein [Rhodocyclaceae bacterium]|nr:NnrS family protein [Rhodocyclaceae bacterium]